MKYWIVIVFSARQEGRVKNLIFNISNNNNTNVVEILVCEIVLFSNKNKSCYTFNSFSKFHNFTFTLLQMQEQTRICLCPT